MTTFFSIKTTALTLWGYPMSYLELVGTVFTLWSVWLAARNNVLTWPIGIVGVVLYIFLFYQIQLYSDLVEQGYFLVTSFWGWWVWTSRQEKGSGKKRELSITYGTNVQNVVAAGVVILGTWAMGYRMSRIHLDFPTLFPERASFPYLDAFTTVMSFVATILMAQKKMECWYLWILVDIIGVGLYYAKNVKFIALEYFIFLILASKGLFFWRSEFQKQTQEDA
jgi:nicotinamide mononucleotide transporter